MLQIISLETLQRCLRTFDRRYIGKNTGGSFSNESLNAATRSAGPAMSGMDKFKTYATAGIKGAGAGFVEGGMNAAPGMIGIPGMQTGDVRQQIRQSIDQVGVDAVHGTQINNSANTIGNNLESVETQTIIHPDNARLGQQLASDPAMQQEFVSRKIDGYKSMSPQMQQQANMKIADQIKSHPASAGGMFNSMMSGDGARPKNGNFV